MKINTHIYFLLTILIVNINVTFANKWYVDNGTNSSDIYTIGSVAGNDITGNGTSSKPYLTLSKAISSANALRRSGCNSNYKNYW